MLGIRPGLKARALGIGTSRSQKSEAKASIFWLLEVPPPRSYGPTLRSDSAPAQPRVGDPSLPDPSGFGHLEPSQPGSKPEKARLKPRFFWLVTGMDGSEPAYSEPRKASSPSQKKRG